MEWEARDDHRQHNDCAMPHGTMRIPDSGEVLALMAFIEARARLEQALEKAVAP